MAAATFWKDFLFCGLISLDIPKGQKKVTLYVDKVQLSIP